MSLGIRKLLKLPAFVKRVSGDERGVTAVEFALVGPVFILTLISAMEMGLLMTKKALLENSATAISRSIYTGSVTNGALSREDLIERICNTISVFDSSCEENVAIELTPIADFHSIPSTDVQCIDSSQPVNPVVTFTPGAGNSIIYMRLCLSTNLYTPGIGFSDKLTKTSTGKFQLITTLAFANEPF